MAAKLKLLVVSVAGLDLETASALSRTRARFTPLHPVFPAVTCSAQATFRTGLPPAIHGMPGNGFYDRRLRKAFFWEQSSALVAGPRFWEPLRNAGGTVGLLFWQQSMGESADFILTPAPLHKHHGGMILDCYSRPAGLYPRLRAALGEFPLHRYWGPLASPAVGNWIAEATANVMGREAPDLLLTYLPTLDYDFQRFGPADPRARRSVALLDAQLASLLEAAGRHGYDWMVWGDYAIEPCAGGALFPNRILWQAGLLDCRNVRGRHYADLQASRAFALADHAVAQVYARRPEDAAAAAGLLGKQPGVAWAAVRGRPSGDPARREIEQLLESPLAGDVVLAAEPGFWFAYPWWMEAREAPDYARHVDIHNKPGYDPCELTWTWFPPGIGTDPARVRGTHGRTDRPAAWACSRIRDPGGEAVPLESLAGLAAGLLGKEPGR